MIKWSLSIRPKQNLRTMGAGVVPLSGMYAEALGQDSILPF